MVRDSNLWVTIWLSFDRVRHAYWKLKNLPHRQPIPDLTGRGKEILESLHADGIAVYPRFVIGDDLRALRRTAKEYAEASTGVNVDAPLPGQYFHLNNMGNEIDSEDPLLRFFCSSEIIGIAGRCLGFYPKLRRIAFFLNQHEEGLSGLGNVEKHFHRDSHDFRVLKFFVYLGDTNESNGPLIYIPRTHFSGSKRGLVCRLPNYISTQEMERHVPSESWRVATGPAGTAIFAETSGIHRGGRTQKGYRLMLVAEYSSHHPWVKFDHDMTEPRSHS